MDKSGGGINGDVPLLGPDVAQATQAGLTKAGILCVLCGRPTGKVTPRDEPHPVEYLRVDVKLEEGKPKPTVVSTRVIVCGRADCDHRGVRGTAHAVRPFRGWEVIDLEEEEAAAKVEEDGVPAARFRKGDAVIIKEEGRRAVVTSVSHHEPTESDPLGWWQYALSTETVPPMDLEGNPFLEDALEPAPTPV